MCGRFTLFASMPALSDRFGAPPAEELSPRYNIAPAQRILAVRPSPATGMREFTRLRWGLVPSWSRDPTIGNRLINARAETAPSKAAFRSAFRSRRCLLPSSGFYEWMRLVGGKQPYFIRLRDGEPFALAGLWEPGTAGGEAQPETCAILTTEANAVVSPIHDRMPVIVRREHYGRWLDSGPESADSLKGVLEPYSPEEMETWPVAPFVNNPKVDDKSCIDPVRDTF